MKFVRRIRAHVRHWQTQVWIAFVAALALCGCMSDVSNLPAEGEIIEGVSQQLILSAYSGSLDDVKKAVRRGASTESRFGMNAGSFFSHIARRNWTALHAASWGGHLNIVRYLLDCGADPDIQDGFGGTPLSYAASRLCRAPEYAEIAILLLSTGADPNIRVGTYIDNPSFYPIHKVIGHTKVLKAMIENGANLKVRDGVGRTPLHWAASAGAIESVKLLLNSGAPVGLSDSSGCTPRDLAVPGSTTDGLLSEVGGVRNKPLPPRDKLSGGAVFGEAKEPSH